MQIYNSKTHRKEELRPIAPPKVTMYVCGPTVYDEIHIGNARTFLSFDVIRRYLTYRGYDVVFAQNLTDVDDKIIARAAEKNTTPEAVAHEFGEKFIERMRAFNVLDPSIRPRATQEIEAMCAMISDLVEKKHAYVTKGGDVYFSVRSIVEYGEVSGRKVDELLVGARVEENAEKNDPLDFALWKAAKPGEPAWESPWGLGRPGWHTECAAMVQKYLDSPVDIHGGGSDLLFPHHENENAQARGAFGTELARIWMHGGMLRVDGEKMSKSLGNFYTLAEVLEHAPAPAIRLLMLQTHYRSPLDFSYERLDGATSALARFENFISRVEWLSAQGVEHFETSKLAEESSLVEREFQEAMDDDFNTASALGALFGLLNKANVELDCDAPDLEGLQVASDTIQRLLGVFGISLGACEEEDRSRLLDVARELGLGDFETADEASRALLSTRASARENRDWTRADAIRDAIQAAGFAVEDGAQGTRIISRDA